MVRLLFFALCCLMLNSACKIYSLTGASINTNVVKTASIPYFQNRAQLQQPMLSRNLTEKLKDKIQSQTSLTLVNESGDILIDGEITGYTVQPAAIQGDNIAAKNRLTVTIHVKYTNSKDDEFDYDTTFSRFEDFDSNSSLDAVENDLIDKIADQLVEDIFNKAFVNW